MVIAVMYFKRNNLRTLNWRGERILCPSNTDLESRESPAAPKEYLEEYKEESEVPLETQTNHAPVTHHTHFTNCKIEDVNVQVGDSNQINT